MIRHATKRRFLRYLTVAGLAFNVLWLAGSLTMGLVDENSFLPSNSLRALAYPYYGPSWRESRFVGIALHELYDDPILVTSQEVLDYLFEVEEVSYHAREVSLRLVDDPERYVTSLPEGDAETYRVGLDAQEVRFIVPAGDDGVWDHVVAIRDGERVLFVPVRGIAD